MLTAVGNLLNNYDQPIITASDYLKLLRQYAGQHYYNNGKTSVLNLQEDYNPETGAPITYGRAYGSHHYNHSSFNDLVITGLCGIRPAEGNTLTIHPLVDCSIKYFCLDEVLYHGHKLTVVYDADGSKYRQGKGLVVFVDGKKAVVKENRGKYDVSIGAPVVTEIPSRTPNLALNIRREGYPQASASVNSVPDSLYQAIDARSWYFTEPVNRWSTVGSVSAEDWFALDFGQTRSVSKVRVMLYADGKTYGVPSGITIEYKNGRQWMPVKVKPSQPKRIIANATHTILFEEVEASQLRIFFNRPSNGQAVAVSEVECY